MWFGCCVCHLLNARVVCPLSSYKEIQFKKILQLLSGCQYKFLLMSKNCASTIQLTTFVIQYIIIAKDITTLLLINNLKIPNIKHDYHLPFVIIKCLSSMLFSSNFLCLELWFLQKHGCLISYHELLQKIIEIMYQWVFKFFFGNISECRWQPDCFVS